MLNYLILKHHISFVETPIFMYDLRSKLKDKSKYPNNQKDVSTTSKSKSRSNYMSVDDPFLKLATNNFSLKKIEEFTSEKSDDSKDNSSCYQMRSQIDRLVIKISK